MAFIGVTTEGSCDEADGSTTTWSKGLAVNADIRLQVGEAASLGFGDAVDA